MTARVLFVHNGRERFVQDDLVLLAREFQVTDWYQPTRQFNPAWLAWLVRTHDLVFCWFASWHSLPSVLLTQCLQRPSVVVVGGYDTANLPEAGYGSQRGGLPKLVSRLVMRQTTHLIGISEAARREAIANASADPGKITVIYPGVHPMPMGRLDTRDKVVLTVGNVWRENLLRKGLLPFVQAAAYLPDTRFVVVGRWHDNSIEELRRAAGPNVEFTGFLPDDELAALYGRAAVYVQASLHEGFGLSVAEAMTAGCIPVVTRNGSLPEVVGDCGIYVESNTPTRVAAAVEQALNLDDARRTQARERVLRLFPMERRAQELGRLIKDVFQSTQ